MKKVGAFIGLLCLVLLISGCATIGMVPERQNDRVGIILGRRTELKVINNAARYYMSIVGKEGLIPPGGVLELSLKTSLIFEGERKELIAQFWTHKAGGEYIGAVVRDFRIGPGLRRESWIVLPPRSRRRRFF